MVMSDGTPVVIKGFLWAVKLRIIRGEYLHFTSYQLTVSILTLSHIVTFTYKFTSEVYFIIKYQYALSKFPVMTG